MCKQEFNKLESSFHSPIFRFNWSVNEQRVLCWIRVVNASRLNAFFFFLLCTLQRWQRSSARQHPLITAGRCSLSVMTCPCCLPNLAHSTSTQKTRKTSRVDWTAAPTTARTVTQVQPAVPMSLPTSRVPHFMILQVRRRTLIQRVSCSDVRPAASKEWPSFSPTADRSPSDICHSFGRPAAKACMHSLVSIFMSNCLINLLFKFFFF